MADLKASTYALNSFREGTYASSIVDLTGLRAQLNNLVVGEKYYFSITMSNGAVKVFYAIIEKGVETGSFTGRFYRDYTTFGGNGMGYNDFLIKGFSSDTEGELEPEIDITDSSVKTELINYIEPFLDAVQVINSMPY